MTTISAILIPVEGDVEAMEYDRKDGLKTLQDAVGGWIEAVEADSQTTLWINEEGKLEGLPINKRATLLWWTLMPAARGYDVLVGDVVVTGGTDSHGNTLSVVKRVKEMLLV